VVEVFERMWRRVLVLAVLADTVSGFQGPWLHTSPLQSRAPSLCCSSRRVAPSLGLRDARSQMGFNSGDGSSKSGGDGSSTGPQGGGGMPGGMPGMPPGMEELFSDPEIAAAMNDPKVMKAMEEMRTGGPAAMAKYASDAEFMALISKVQAKMASVTGGMPNMPNMPPGMAGFNAGGMPSMPPGMDKVLGDPEIMKAMQNPKMMKAMMEMMQGGPEAMKKYETDPEFADLLAKIQAKLGAPSSTAPGKTDAPAKQQGYDKSSADSPSEALGWNKPAFKTAPGGGGFGFEAVLSKDGPPTESPSSDKSKQEPSSATSSPSAGGLDEQQRAAFEKLMKRQAAEPPSGGKIGFDTGDASSGEGGSETAKGASSLEEGLKAKIAEVNQKTEEMLDQQQKEAFERLKRRQAEEEAARQRYLEGEQKYKEFVKTTRNMAARDKEQFVKGVGNLLNPTSEMTEIPKLSTPNLNLLNPTSEMTENPKP
jgi:hypothetical protein